MSTPKALLFAQGIVSHPEVREVMAVHAAEELRRLYAMNVMLLAMLKEATQFVEHNLWPEHEFVMRLKDTIATAQK